MGMSSGNSAATVIHGIKVWVGEALKSFGRGRMVELPNSPHAVVTGAARGIGREIALQLTEAGAVVTALGRQSAALQELVAQGGARSFAIAAPGSSRSCPT